MAIMMTTKHFKFPAQKNNSQAQQGSHSLEDNTNDLLDDDGMTHWKINNVIVFNNINIMIYLLIVKCKTVLSDIEALV